MQVELQAAAQWRLLLLDVTQWRHYFLLRYDQLLEVCLQLQLDFFLGELGSSHLLLVIVDGVDDKDVERDEQHETEGAHLDELVQLKAVVDGGQGEVVAKLEEVDEDELLDDGHVGASDLEFSVLAFVFVTSLAHLEPDLDDHQGENDHEN